MMEQPTNKAIRRLLMISTDRSIFEDGSSARSRQISYAKDWGEVHIIIFAGKSFKEQSIAANCWIYPTRSRFKFFYPFDAISLGRFVIQKRGITDITTQDASLTAMAGASLKKRFSLPLEIQVHEDIGSPHYAFNAVNKIRKALALAYIPKADSVRVVSERIKKYLVETVGIDPAKISVRPIAVDTDSIKSMPIDPNADLHKKYPQFKKIILMASRLEKEKNIPLAIEAFKEVLKKIPDAGLIIVGEGSQKEKLERIANRLGLIGASNGRGSDGGLSTSGELQSNRSVIFEGWADKATLISYYKTADLFLNASLFEGYGMALVEARAAGCKIVSTDVGVAREVGAIITAPEFSEIAETLMREL